MEFTFLGEILDLFSLVTALELKRPELDSVKNRKDIELKFVAFYLLLLLLLLHIIITMDIKDKKGFEQVLNCVLDFAVNVCVPGDKLELDVEWDSDKEFKPIYLVWTMKGFEEAEAKEAEEKKKKEEEEKAKRKNKKRKRAEKDEEREEKKEKEEDDDDDDEMPPERRLCHSRMLDFCEYMKPDFLLSVAIATGWCKVLVCFHSPHAKENSDEEGEKKDEGTTSMTSNSSSNSSSPSVDLNANLSAEATAEKEGTANQ